MTKPNAADEDWGLLLSFFPAKWKKLAELTGALKGLRQDKSEENYLRVLLMHFGCGFSMRETVVRAKQAELAELSDVALLKRLRKSKGWLHQLCCELFEERGIKSQSPPGTSLPKHDDESAQAWLYGKLFVALLTEKVIRQANSFSPWGYPLPEQTSTESVA